MNTNPGKYGSFAVDLYNGGGYSELEFNNNKLLEARLSFRPFPEQMPGFQASVLGTHGKGNIPESPNFNLLGSALTYESERMNMVLLGFRGTGDGSGRFIDPVSFEAFKLNGWSAFAEFLPFDLPVSPTVRYDELYNKDHEHFSIQQGIAGLAIFSRTAQRFCWM